MSATIACTKPLPQHLGCGSTCHSKIKWVWLTNNPGVQQNVSSSGAEKIGCMSYSKKFCLMRRIRIVIVYNTVRYCCCHKNVCDKYILGCCTHQLLILSQN